MPSFLPRTASVEYVPPVCADPGDVFQNPSYSATVGRVIDYLYRIYVSHSDGAFDRILRQGIVTEQFFVFMGTRDAYSAEVDLVNAIRDHALGNINDENVKVYLQKYIDSHVFVYRETKEGWTQEFKTGYSKQTHWRDVPLFEVGQGKSAHVANAIQAEIFILLEKKNGNNVKRSSKPI